MKLGKEVYRNFEKIDLKKSDFNRVRRMIYDYSGIYLHEGKEALVRARLMKRIRKLGMQSFKEYLNSIENDVRAPEFLSFVDVLTTNKTDFFRENEHFHFLRDEVIPKIGARKVRWWSAGCSTGEEPVTMAISLLEELKPGKSSPVKILATDISGEVLLHAKTGIYSQERMRGVSGFIKDKYFKKSSHNGSQPVYKVAKNIREMITYGRLNLKGPWPLKGPFQVIMCRNVLIYFKRQTQQELVSRFYDMLEDGGYLFLGHSESVAGQNHGFTSIRPSVYQKKGK